MLRWSLFMLLAATDPAAAAQDAPRAQEGEPIFAPPPKAQPRPPLTPEHLELARRLAGLIVLSEIREELLQAPPGQALDDDGDPLTNPRIVARRSARWNVAAAAATAYARLYSMSELEMLVAFFESPAGQKYLSARRQGVVDVMHVFQQLPWYPELFYEVCGDQEFCRWKPEK